MNYGNYIVYVPKMYKDVKSHKKLCNDEYTYVEAKDESNSNSESKVHFWFVLLFNNLTLTDNLLIQWFHCVGCEPFYTICGN